MTGKPRCFVAYPSNPPALAETIENSIEQIQQGHIVDVKGWKSTSVSGNFIITAICKSIDDSDIFICDLTTLNHNVLFELGYAISRKKRIWIVFDPNIEESKNDYERFKLFTTIGYSSYSNSKDIVQGFYKDQPYSDLDNTVYKNSIEHVISHSDRLGLLYLKSSIETEASIALSRIIAGCTITSIVDDPKEVRTQTLSWYAQKAYSSYALITHFVASHHAGWRLHNAKNSFVSGLAYGFGKRLLMLAHAPYQSPIDYRDLLEVHNTAAECEKFATSWLENRENEYKQYEASALHHRDEVKAQTELQSITIGDPVAEHEIQGLTEYFIPTSSYKEAIRSEYSIFIGRKGSGKTANFYKISQEISKDQRNNVCIIKPVAYEIEGILRVLNQSIPKSEKGFLLESFWKFLDCCDLPFLTFV